MKVRKQEISRKARNLSAESLVQVKGAMAQNTKQGGKDEERTNNIF